MKHKAMSSRYVREMARAPSLKEERRPVYETRRETNITRKVVYGIIYVGVIILGVIAVKIILDTYGGTGQGEPLSLLEYINQLITYFK